MHTSDADVHTSSLLYPLERACGGRQLNFFLVESARNVPKWYRYPFVRAVKVAFVDRAKTTIAVRAEGRRELKSRSSSRQSVSSCRATMRFDAVPGLGKLLILLSRVQRKFEMPPETKSWKSTKDSVIISFLACIGAFSWRQDRFATIIVPAYDFEIGIRLSDLITERKAAHLLKVS